jgi:hypothetical protein
MLADDSTRDVPAFAQRHYTVPELARLWVFCDDIVRELFEHEEGVIRIGGERSSGKKRRYISLRIPADVVERVYRRLQATDARRKTGAR